MTWRRRLNRGPTVGLHNTSPATFTSGELGNLAGLVATRGVLTQRRFSYGELLNRPG